MFLESLFETRSKKGQRTDVMRRTKQKQITIVDCRFAAKTTKILSRKSTVAMRLFAVLLLGTLLGGCSTVSPWAKARQLSYQAKLSAPYDQIKLKQSVIHDAVPKIQRLKDKPGAGFAGDELISYSENVVVSLGQSKDGYQNWFNMVTFQENELNAILRNVLGNLRKDIGELSNDTDATGQENKMLDICGMLINQTFEVILRELYSSPVLATRLSQAGGVEFDHINFDKGKIQMVVGADIVRVKIRLGAFTHMIEVKKSKTKKERVRKPSSVFRR